MTDQLHTPSAKRAGWEEPILAIVVTVAIYFFAQVAVGIVLSLVPLLWGWNTAQIEKWLDMSLAAQFISIVLLETVTLWTLWSFLKSRRTKPADIGLVKPQGRDLWYAILGYVVYYLCLVVLATAVGRLVPGLDMNQEQDIGFNRSTTGLSLVPIFVSLVLLPPFVEEVLARGFLYTGLRKKLSFVPAAIVTSILFAAAHLQGGKGPQLLWVAALDTFTLSLILVYLREKSGSLWASILVHMIKNGVAFTYLFILTR